MYILFLCVIHTHIHILKHLYAHIYVNAECAGVDGVETLCECLETRLNKYQQKQVKDLEVEGERKKSTHTQRQYSLASVFGEKLLWKQFREEKTTKLPEFEIKYIYTNTRMICSLCYCAWAYEKESVKGGKKAPIYPR